MENWWKLRILSKKLFLRTDIKKIDRKENRPKEFLADTITIKQQELNPFSRKEKLAARTNKYKERVEHINFQEIPSAVKKNGQKFFLTDSKNLPKKIRYKKFSCVQKTLNFILISSKTMESMMSRLFVYCTILVTLPDT